MRTGHSSCQLTTPLPNRVAHCINPDSIGVVLDQVYTALVVLALLVVAECIHREAEACIRRVEVELTHRVEGCSIHPHRVQRIDHREQPPEVLSTPE